MHVCTLNTTFYGKFFPDIASDEVIITDKQFAHIKERHPGDEQYLIFSAEIINDPDCVFAGNTERTLLILKELPLEKPQPVKLVLWLKTSSDPDDYKNSVLTFTRTDYKEWARLLKKKPVLYSKAP